MELNKLETQFKEQLNSREIKPSDMAWEKLDAMLAVAEKKKPKRSYAWIYVAASFVGFLLIATLYFSQKNSAVENQKTQIVIQQSVPNIKSGEPLKALNPNSEKSTSVAFVNGKVAIKNNKTLVLKKDSLINKNNQNQATEFLIINQKKEQESNSNINEKSIDEMLAAVKINSKSDNSKKAVKVNSNVLLSQVDQELELSFREKVINKVNKNYQTVKVALGSRNQE